jgi:hypothetical protein
MAEMSHPELVEGSSQAAPKDPRPVYEVGFHVLPTVEEGNVGGILEAIRTELGIGNAEIIAEQFPKKMALAYTIERAVSSKREKYTNAYFGRLCIISGLLKLKASSICAEKFSFCFWRMALSLSQK